MKKYILCLILVALCTKAEPMQHNLVMQFCDAETLMFALTEKPVAILRADSLLIATDKFQTAYLRDEICDFYFLQAHDDTNSLPEHTIYIEYLKDHIIRINGVHKGDKATIYNVDGKLLLTQTINNNEYILDLNAYAGGLYLIQVLYKHKDTDKQQVISFKIIR